jgi:serine/threonine protein phosphatase PrpC
MTSKTLKLSSAVTQRVVNYSLFPESPQKPFDRFSVKTDSLLVEGTVRKNFLSDGKDSVAIFTSDELTLIAVCDGSMGRGAYFSSKLASLLIEHTFRQDEKPTLSILSKIAQAAITELFDLEQRTNQSGDALSTLTFVSIFPDGTYHAIAVGDSPLFRFSTGSSERHFDYSKVLLLSSDGTRLIRTPARGLPLDVYEKSLRNTYYVGYDSEGGIVSYDFEYATGNLTSGSRLLIATDGLTKVGIHGLSSVGQTPLIKSTDQIMDWGAVVSTYSTLGSSLEHLIATIDSRSLRSSLLMLAPNQHCFRVHDDVTCVLVEKK